MSTRDPDCFLCRVIAGDTEVPFASVVDGRRVAEQTLAEARGARIIVDVAPIVPGHLLVVSDAHISSLAHCSADLLQEIGVLRKWIRSVFREEFRSDPVWFEHGECRTTSTASCRVYHVHLHALPAESEVVTAVEAHYDFIPVSGIEELPGVARDRSYLYLETRTGGARVAIVPDPPSQVLRKTVCDALGVPERWNWHDQVALRTRETAARLLDTLAKVAPHVPGDG